MCGSLFCGMYSSSGFGSLSMTKQAAAMIAKSAWSARGILVIKKSLGVVLLALTGVGLSDTAAFAGADYTHLCVAAATGDAGRVFIGSASTTPLAATGTGFDIGAWVFAGIAILIVGVAFTLL